MTISLSRFIPINIVSFVDDLRILYFLFSVTNNSLSILSIFSLTLYDTLSLQIFSFLPHQHVIMCHAPSFYSLHPHFPALLKFSLFHLQPLLDYDVVRHPWPQSSKHSLLPHSGLFAMELQLAYLLRSFAKHHNFHVIKPNIPWQQFQLNSTCTDEFFSTFTNNHQPFVQLNLLQLECCHPQHIFSSHQ